MFTGTSKVFLFDNYAALMLDDRTSGEHKHGACQLSISLDGIPHSVGPANDRLRPGLGHLVGSNQVHVFDGSSGKQALFWIAPESALAHSVASELLYQNGFGVLPDSLLRQLPLDGLLRALTEGWPGARIEPVFDEIMRSLSPSPLASSDQLHPAIRNAVEIIQSLDEKAISADELAARVGLSTSRLLHLFSESMGTPLRPYLQWLRLIDALVRVMNGTSVARAAVEAGFADASHLNRTTQRFLGMRPLDFTRRPDLTIEVCLTGR